MTLQSTSIPLLSTPYHSIPINKTFLLTRQQPECFSYRLLLFRCNNVKDNKIM